MTENNKRKKTLLVFASTFPRWKNDTNPPFVYELSKRLTNEFNVHILTPSYPGAKDKEVMDNMQVHRFHYFLKKYEKLAGSGGILPTLKKNKFFYFQVPFFMFAEYFALKKLTKQIQPDIIHAHWIIPQGFITALAQKTTKVPYVVTSHGSDIMGLKGFNSIKRFTLKNAKKITVVSNAIKKQVLDEIDSSLDIEVIPMGIDTKLFNPNKKDLSIKKKHGITGPFLLFVGRLSYEKGIDLLIDAMPEVINQNPKTKLMIIGDGVLKEDLIKRVKELEIQNNIIFTGWIKNEDLPKYYATADLFVCPSRREGFGLTFVEAGMSGCWLIGTNVGGISDIIQNGKNGQIVKQKNPQEIAKSIQNFQKTKSYRKKILNKFDWKNIVKQYQEVIG